MGRTVPSYRMALEFEISRWREFRNGLSSDQEKEAFDELMDMCREHSSAASNATNPILFEPMAMSILLAQQLHLARLERRVCELEQKLGKLEGQVYERIWAEQREKG